MTQDTLPNAPISTVDRIAELDSLRGWALLGVAIANLTAFTLWFAVSPEVKAAMPTAAIDGPLEYLTHVFVEGKFYTLFSLLFGIGFAVQLTRAETRGDAFGSRFRRRLTVLLAIGLVHLCLIWFGDILVLYALCGFGLLAFRQRSDRSLLTWAFVLLLLPVVQHAAMWAVYDPANPASITYANPGVALFRLNELALAALGQNEFAALSTGGWRDVLETNLAGPLWRYGYIFYTGRVFKVFGIFLIGLWCGRRLMQGTLLTDTLLLKRVVAWGLGVGLPANFVLAWLMLDEGDYPPGAEGLAQSIAYALGVVPLAMAYAAGFVLLWRRASWRSRLSVTAPVGRMALTNYLAQTLMGIGLFYGIGLGLGMKVGPATWTMIGLLAFGGQIVLSAWWLRHFRYGPMEWVWRRLTYGRPLPMKIAREGVIQLA